MILAQEEEEEEEDEEEDGLLFTGKIQMKEQLNLKNKIG